MFCETSDLSIPWKKISRGLPRGRRYADDRAPTIEEIRRILKYPDRRIKLTMTTIVDKELHNNETRSVQVIRGVDLEEKRAQQEGRAKKRYYPQKTKTLNDLKNEVRTVRNVQHHAKQFGRHYYNISIPKSYCRIFKISNKDLFVWELVKTEPLTFTLRKLDTHDTLTEDGER